MENKMKEYVANSVVIPGNQILLFKGEPGHLILSHAESVWDSLFNVGTLEELCKDRFIRITIESTTGVIPDLPDEVKVNEVIQEK